MGAWNLSLFTSDFDYDTLGGIAVDIGLRELEASHGKKDAFKDKDPATNRAAEHKRASKSKPESRMFSILPYFFLTKDESSEINYSVYAPLCSDVEAVRKYLDEGGFAKGIAYYSQKRFKGQPVQIEEPWGFRNGLVMLVASAMTLGAQIDDLAMEKARRGYKKCGLMRDALVQMETALDPVNGYKNDGTPWDFGSKALYDTIEAGGAKKEDLLFPGTGSPNVPAPDHGSRPDDMMSLKATALTCIAEKEMSAKYLATCFANLAAMGQPAGKDVKKKVKVFSNEVCGACGTEEATDGSALVVCSKCKQRCYCSKACQKVHWSEHKKDCKVPAGGK